MNDQQSKLAELLDNAVKILILSHVSPDPDAICSMLLLGTTLQLNYPHKEITMSSEEPLNDLSWLRDYDKIQIQPLLDAVKDRPDLIIIVDAMNLGRTTRTETVAIRQQVAGTPIVVIDHHEPVGVEPEALYSNNGYPAAAQEVYELLFNGLKLKTPEGYAQTAMTGLYSDTGGFAYLNDTYGKTLDLVKELIAQGANVEEIANKLNQYTEDQMKVFAQLATNATHAKDYSYTFLGDDFINDWTNQSKPFEDIRTARKIFMNQFVRNIGGRSWGFSLYKDPAMGTDAYSLSMRSEGGNPDVAAITNKLGGGGHKPAAGAKVEAPNLQAAVKTVQDVISTFV